MAVPPGTFTSYSARGNRERLSQTIERDWGNLPASSSVGTINLAPTTIPDSAAIGAIIGSFSVSGGSGNYVYALTSNPGGLFSVFSNFLEVNANLTGSAGIYPITVQASNGTSTITGNFTITVMGTVVVSYIPTFELLGF